MCRYIVLSIIKNISALFKIRYAAGLLLDTMITGCESTKEECQKINEACKNAGLNFVFNESARLISLNEIQQTCTSISYIKTISSNNPLKHAVPQKRQQSQTPAQKKSQGAVTVSPVNTPSPHSSPTSTPPSQISQTIKIVPLVFDNLTISCLVKGRMDDSFGLLETIFMLYFDDYKFDDLVYVLTVRLKVQLNVLANEEENAFISFYGLQTKKLNSNLAISMHQFVSIYPRLRDLLPRKRPPRHHSPAQQVEQGHPNQTCPQDKDIRCRELFTEHVHKIQELYENKNKYRSADGIDHSTEQAVDIVNSKHELELKRSLSFDEYDNALTKHQRYS